MLVFGTKSIWKVKVMGQSSTSRAENKSSAIAGMGDCVSETSRLLSANCKHVTDS